MPQRRNKIRRSNQSAASAENFVEQRKQETTGAPSSLLFPSRVYEMRKIRFTAFKYDASVRRERRIKDGSPIGSVMLPLPQELQTNFNANFSDEQLIAETGSGAASTSLEGLAKLGLQGVKGVGDFLGLAPDVQVRAGYALNPNTELMYGSHVLRTHTFSFTMVPRNEAEAKQVVAIKKFFEKNNLQRKKNAVNAPVLEFPPMFSITMMEANSGREMSSLHFILPSHLIDVSVQENPQGYSSFIKGADGTSYPVATLITLAFREARMLTQEDFE